MTKSELQIEGRLSTLEAQYTALDGKISEIKDNHLAHLDAKVDRIQWLIVTTLAVLATNLIMQLLK